MRRIGAGWKSMSAATSMVSGQVRSRHGFGRPMNVEQLSRVLADRMGGVPVVVEDSKMGWQGNADEAQSNRPQSRLLRGGP
jgi:hypothetical protein